MQPDLSFEDEVAGGLSFDEVFVDLSGLAARGASASFVVRSAGREILAEVVGVVVSVGWDRSSETLGMGRVIEVRGDGWVVRVPEREFREGAIWLAGGGLTVEMDGYTVEAGRAAGLEGSA